MSQQSINPNAVYEYLQGLQNRIVESVELIDGKNFLNDSWQRPEGGGGTSCMLEEGNVFERAGIGFSHVKGSRLPPAATAAHPEAAGRAWEAMGVSLVFHPRNPYIPTVHMNVRFFVAKAQAGKDEQVRQLVPLHHDRTQLPDEDFHRSVSPLLLLTVLNIYLGMLVSHQSQ